MTNEEYSKLTDEELCLRTSGGDNDAMEFLLKKYKNLVKSRAHSYFLVGADKEDIAQEGMIGLYKAIRDFNPDKQTSFLGFAEVCISRQMLSAIRTATRQKHIPLNSYISINKPLFEDGEQTLMDVMVSDSIGPEEATVTGESASRLRSRLYEQLTEFEAACLDSYLEGYTYEQIAEKLSVRFKSVDNALQRVRRKLQKLLDDRKNGEDGIGPMTDSGKKQEDINDNRP